MKYTHIYMNGENNSLGSAVPIKYNGTTKCYISVVVAVFSIYRKVNLIVLMDCKTQEMCFVLITVTLHFLAVVFLAYILKSF
jgi:hypothetical protein